MICPYCGKLIAYNSYFDVFYCLKCGGFFKQATVMECNDLNKPLTNAQKIRSMSDEELAKAIFNWLFMKEHCDMCVPEMQTPKKCNGRCTSGILRWLQRPAEEDDHA